ALSALEDEMVPIKMANGTDLAGALRAAGDLLRSDAATFAPRALVVILTDGAVGASLPGGGGENAGAAGTGGHGRARLPGGAAAVVSLDAKAARLVSASMTIVTGAETRGVPVKMVAVEPRWLPPPKEASAASEARALFGPALAVLVEPVARPNGDVEEPGPRGFLERSVVRDALSLAFTPRAR